MAYQTRPVVEPRQERGIPGLQPMQRAHRETQTTRRVRVGLVLYGSEYGPGELVRGAELARRHRPDLEICLIGPGPESTFRCYGAGGVQEAHQQLEALLESGEIAAGVAAAYPYPPGVTTVARVATPGRGREMLIAGTAGSCGTDRVEAMVRGTVAGLAVAHTLGMANPTVGILNLDGAATAEGLLRRLAAGGYRLRWAESATGSSGPLLHGTDVLQGSADLLVCDPLTGGLLVKMLSAFHTGGRYETLGCGYGPGVGPGFHRIVSLISPAAGAPVVAGALAYAADLARGGLVETAAMEYARAEAAGLLALLEAHTRGGRAGGERVDRPVVPGSGNAPGNGSAPGNGFHGLTPPPAKPATYEIPGVDLLALEEAVRFLWWRGVYAEGGVGTQGPVVRVAPEDATAARAALWAGRYLAH